MAADPQLVDYIKKAQEAGQPDNLTRELLYKNGWTEEEVNEAYNEVLKTSSSQSAPSVSQGLSQKQEEESFSPQQTTPQVSGEPELKIQKEQTSMPPSMESVYSSGFSYQEKPKKRRGILIILLVLVLVAIIAVVLSLLVLKPSLFSLITQTTEKEEYVSPPKPQPQPQPQPLSQTPEEEVLVTQAVTAILENYDATKISAIAFNQKKDKVVFCAPLKTNATKFSCFLNGQKLFDSPYPFKPYWAGISPNETRIIFLYYDSVKKQSFIFENEKEGQRYNGVITYPVFSSNSQYFAFMVMANDGKNFIVLNDRTGDKVGESYEKIYTPSEFSEDNKYLYYGARNGNNLLWVVNEIKNFGKKEEKEIPPPQQQSSEEENSSQNSSPSE